MLVAGFLFGCMGVFVKLGAPYFSNVELVFYRSFVGLIIIYAILHQRGGKLATPNWPGHLWRGVSGSRAAGGGLRGAGVGRKTAESSPQRRQVVVAAQDE